MAATNGPSKVEGIKTGSDYLRGSMAEELLNDRPDFDGDTTQLLKFHGSYQQDDREKRKLKDADGNPLGKQFIMMLRTVIPGGVLTAEQMLAHFDIADLLGYGTARLTSRQGIQLHGIPKGSLREAIRRINEIAMTTLAACGDVSRNVMCCPAPIKDDPVHAEMQRVAGQIKELMKPRSGAYYDLWLRDADDPEAEKLDVAVPEAKFNGVDISEDRVREIGDSGDAVEPMYGLTYLPRKFKIGIALPEDNCADIYTQDIGLMVLRSADGRSIRGYNMIVGGGMGVTPAKKDTFPRVGDKMAFVKPEQLFEAIVAVVTVQRDHGNRENRKRARLKYLV
ncbi:MAG: NADPH-dependent assimilatory sulfite reductase hemoprotein subunit, partial [Planctomycetota bacterium]